MIKLIWKSIFLNIIYNTHLYISHSHTNLNDEELYDDNDEFIDKIIENNNLITLNNKQSIDKTHKLTISKLISTLDSPIYNLNDDKELILNIYKNKSGIYLIHNDINGKYYIGSALNLNKRIATYYFPSRLCDNRYISNSILKYGHNNFSLVILSNLGESNLISKNEIINNEQKYMDIYKPILNLNPKAGSSQGFIYTE